MKAKEGKIGAVEGCCVFSAWNASHTLAHRLIETHTHTRVPTVGRTDACYVNAFKTLELCMV